MLLPSPERRANTERTQGNYPSLAHLLRPHEEVRKNIAPATLEMLSKVPQNIAATVVSDNDE